MQKNYILDTNVLIEDPNCINLLRNGDENIILIPYAVFMELERLKKRPDLGHLLAAIAGLLEADDALRVIRIPDKRYSFDKANDNDILDDIRYAFNAGNLLPAENETIVVTNDRLFRVRLKLEGFRTQEYKSSRPFQSESQIFTGFIERDGEKVPNCFWWDEVGQLSFEGRNATIDYEHDPWGIRPRTPYQNCAMELMLSEHIDITTIQSEAGFGKTFIALACALRLVLQKPRQFDKIFIFKPAVEIGEKLGYLPGDEKDKIAPYMRGIIDLVIKLHNRRPANALFVDPEAASLDLNPKKIEIVSLNFIRGLNIENAVVIIDEAQNLSRYQTRALLTRMGENVKCFALGDTNQVDNPYLNSQNNGLNWMVKKFKGHRNYGHIVLHGSRSRGPITDLVLKTGL